MITGIDHPVIAVENMDAAHAAYRRLGFTIAPRGAHLEWGTGNWCMMFPDDYLELRGIVSPEKYTHSLEKVLAEHGEGLMGVAFGTGNAEAVFTQLTERGLHPQPVRKLTRNFELPEGNVQLSFALCFLDAQETGGMMSVVFCQHLTPHLLRQPAWLLHANSVVGVHSLTCIATDLKAAATTHAAIFGAESIDRINDRLSVNVGGQAKVIVMAEQAARERFPRWKSAKGSGPGRIAAATFRAADLDQCRRHFASEGIDCHAGPDDSICVDPSEACGALLEFVAD